MDIKALAPVSEDAGTFVQWDDAAGNPLFEDDAQTVPVGCKVVGTYSEKFRVAQKALRDTVRKSVQRGRPLTEDQLEDEQYKLEAACIIEWSLTSEGKPFPITGPNWRAVLVSQPQWRDKTVGAMGDHERFFDKR